MAERRRICVVTGSRAEYGLLCRLLEEIEADPGLELQLVVTGAHLAPAHGLTWRAIAEDGFPIAAKVDMGLAGDSAADIARAMGRGIAGMGEAVARLRPHIVVVLGDRFEILAAVAAVLVAAVPVAHIHGGEVTEGAFDDAIRHAITKMAHLHFVAAEPYRRRVIQMGEDPGRVFTVGAPGLDGVARTAFMSRAALEADLGFALGEGFLLVTYHPATLGGRPPAEAAGELLAALDAFPERRVLFTGVNADPGRDAVARAVTEYAAARPERVRAVDSLGRRRYLSALKHCAAVAGNSSSGLIEAPAVGTPTVNVGGRQAGRLRAASVIDCAEDRDAVAAALRRALDPAFMAAAADVPSPYGEPGASARIKAILKDVPLEGLVAKGFCDLAEAS